MEVVGSGHHALVQHIEGIVLAGFHLVPYHRHLGIQVLLEHGHIHHAILFQAQRPAQVLVAGVKGLKVHRLIGRCLAVEAAARAVSQLLEELSARLRAFEGHVLQQVRHAGFAVAFIARAHQVNHVHRDLGLGVIRKQ